MPFEWQLLKKCRIFESLLKLATSTHHTLSRAGRGGAFNDDVSFYLEPTHHPTMMGTRAAMVLAKAVGAIPALG